MKISEYERGHKDAIRAAVTWLLAEAKTMNDPRARDVIGMTAAGLGAAFAAPEVKAQVKRAADHVLAKPTRPPTP